MTLRIGGVVVSQAEEVLVLPRTNGPDIVFKAASILSMDEFDAMCPKPQPTVSLMANGEKKPDITSKDFLNMIRVWGQRRHYYICVKSLEPSNIEWEIVKEDQPATWEKWGDELQDAGLSQVECNRVQNLILEANALNETKLKEARDAFLLGQGKEA